MKNTKKRLLAFVLALLMIVTSVPVIPLTQEGAQAAITVSEKPADGATQGQPFASGTAGSTYFRIPALITAKDGVLVAASDARWETTADAKGIDTIVSRSSNKGTNWNYTFANYLGDYGNTATKWAATFIDPELAYDETTGTIYMLVDLYAGNYAINTAEYRPITGNAFTNAGYLKLKAAGATEYAYYLKEGKIYGTDTDGAEVEVEGYTVDEYFNLKYNGADAGNLFFNAESSEDLPAYQAYPTTYLYLTKSTDNGATWSAPQLLNVKNESEYFYGVGPGRGLVTSDGTIVFSAYIYAGSNESQKASFIYSTDGGQTWSRTENATSSIWSSESQIIELNDGTLRMFFRNGQGQICYVDATGNGTDGYTWGSYVATGVSNESTCQISAIKYSKKIDGKEAILVSCPTGSGRYTGKIFVGLINEDDENSIEWKYTYAGFGTGRFQYSCMTELTDGSIGILYEDGAASITYANIDIEDIAEDAMIGNFWLEDTDGDAVSILEMKPGENATVNVISEAGTTVTVSSSDESIVTANIDPVSAASEEELNTTAITLTADDSVTGIKTAVVTASDGKNEVNLKVVVAASDNYQVVILTPGQTKIFIDKTVNCGDTDVSGVDSEVAKAAVRAIEQYAQLATAEGNFDGELLDVSDCLYTFTQSADNTYTISSTTADGETVYLHHRTGTATIPNDTASTTITLAEQGSNTFSLWDNTGRDGGYLYFHKNTLYFNRQSSLAGECYYEIYTPTTEDVTSPIKGYKQITSLDEIENGGQYLIVSQGTDGNYYMLRPYSGGSNFNHVAKIVDASSVNSAQIIFTGVADGETEVQVGDITYYVIVEGEVKNITIKVGESYSASGAVQGKDDNATIVTTETGALQAPYTKASGIVSGEKYLIGSESYLVKPEAISITATNDPDGLAMASVNYTSDNLAAYMWTITEVEGGYTIKNSAGAYMTFGNVSTQECAITMESAPQTLNITARNAGGYEITHTYSADRTHYLNDFRGDHDNAAGWTENGTNWYFWQGTEGTGITGVTPGKTTMIVGGVKYNITVCNEEYNKTITIGESFLAPGDTAEEPTVADIVSVKATDSAAPYTALSQSILDNGGIPNGKYLIGRTGYVVTSDTQTSGDNRGLDIKAADLTTDDLSKYLWTFTQVDGGYTIQNVDGKYVTISGSSVVLSDTAQVLGIVTNDAGGFGIRTTSNDNYLNNYANQNDILLTWSQNDAGSNLYIYTPSAGIEVTGENLGTTTMMIDGNLYNITVVRYADDSYLQQLIRIATSLASQTDVYTPASIAVLQEALTNAQQVTVDADGYMSDTEADTVQQAVDAAVAELTSAINKLAKHSISVSLNLSVGETITRSVAIGEWGNEYDSNIVEIVDNGNRTMELIGKAPGTTTMTVTNTYDTEDTSDDITVTYSIMVALEKDDCPITIGTGQGAGEVITKLIISADVQAFDLNLETTDGTVTWSSADESIVTINENGTISCVDDTTNPATVTRYTFVTVTVTADDGTVTTYTIPVVVMPGEYSETDSDTDGDAKKLTNIYISEITDTEVYYSWNCGTDLYHACEGEVIYVNYAESEKYCIDFFGAPAEGYALTYMSSTDSSGHYMTTHESDSLKLDESEKGFLNYPGGAGVHQSNFWSEAEVMSMLYVAIAKDCDGAMGFTRGTSDYSDTNSVLVFRSQKLPTVEKTVRGILGTSGLAVDYRQYTEGMTAHLGEIVYFEIAVTSYGIANADETITYSDVWLEDHMVQGAGDVGFIVRDDITLNLLGTTRNISNDFKSSTADEVTNYYYVAYQITDEDFMEETDAELINHIDLTYEYKAKYSTGSYISSYADEASIVASDFLAEPYVVDYGLPLEIDLTGTTGAHVITKAGGQNAEALTAEGTTEQGATVKVTEENKILYTPTKPLQGIDIIKIADDKDHTFYIKIYPANSVYYEESFLDISGNETNWTQTGSVTATQQLAVPGEAVQKKSTTSDETVAYNYGYDSAYAEATKSELSTTTANASGTFTFTGTGLDVYANCDDGTGIATVFIRNDEGRLKRVLSVNTVLKPGTIDANVTDYLATAETFNVPVISIPTGLDYDTYTATVYHTVTNDEGGNAEASEIRLDGFRVYGTLTDEDAISEDDGKSVYVKDLEGDPLFYEMRDSIGLGLNIKNNTSGSVYAENVAENVWSQVYAEGGNKLTGALLVSSSDDTTTAVITDENLTDFLDNCSKNELFLYPGQSLIFNLAYALNEANPQIGLRALNGDLTYTITASSNAGANTSTTSYELKSNTEMYYRLKMDSDATTGADGTTFTITNPAGSGRILSVTKLKHSNVYAIAPLAFGTLDEQDLIPALLALGYGEEAAQTPETDKNTEPDKTPDKEQNTNKDDKLDSMKDKTSENDKTEVKSDSKTESASAAPVIKVTKKKNGKVLVQWKKQKGYYYQVQYSKKKNKSFKTAMKGKQVSKYVVKKLKTGRKWFFRVRCYKIVNGKRVYSEYSKVKKIKL